MTTPPRAPAPAEGELPSLPIAVTMGDPAGIGPDITLLAWLERRQRHLPAFAVHADPDVLAKRARDLGVSVPLAVVASAGEVAAAFADALPVLPVRTRGDAGVVEAIEQAASAVIGGRALALLTNPIAKKSLQAARLTEPGHTEFLGLLAARHFAGRTFRPVMMLACEELKVVPATVHMPLSAVPNALTRELLRETVRITAAALEQDFGIAHPRIVLAGLNPHAGEGRMLGREDEDVVGAVAAELAAEGLAVTGPRSADALFHAEARSTYDAVIAMYHDQALIPIKTLAFDRAVNVTLGLPFIRTSPDHGTAFAIAGTGKARPGSFLAALELAHQLGRRRARALRPAPR